ncbi:hypothetical protein GCM10020358_26160 [Amorphoplanes nipponensis]|uniref:Uncharacterized protein n=1 Tax=Actinoplanes nipponensis TaxID=135950 RepID=A0A919JU26_9ACTN|nr:hypothetical protein [Actinoplanes nipponensis]GIE53004.1 hypothetical protein Ani05nite_65380 [Actinoplanes nipponensis]
MGYSGHVLIARGERPLSESGVLAPVQVLHESGYAGGWQRAQLDGDLPGALDALLAQTGAPALVAYIMDSDLADVSAASPGGVRWRAYLHQETAEDYGAPALPQSTDEVVTQALAWAAEAGLAPDREAVRAALLAGHTFAEETLDELVEALGIGPAE